VGGAVNLAVNSLVVLDVQSHLANIAFEADFVVSLLQGSETFQWVGSFATDSALRSRHVVGFCGLKGFGGLLSMKINEIERETRTVV